MRWAVAGFGVLLVLVALAAPPGLVAFPSSPGQFTSTYPNTAGTKLDGCITCHASNSGGPLNAYGSAVSAAGFAYAAIEALDSDGDTYSNIDEINALTFPGNPNDFPEEEPPGPCDPDDPDCPEPPEPEGRIHDRAALLAARDGYSAGVGAADNLDGALAVVSGRVDLAASGRAGRASDGVFGIAIDREGAVDPEGIQLSTLSGAHVHGVAYDGLRNMLIAWSGGGSGIMAQAFNAKNGNPRGSASMIAAGNNASVVWEPGVERFLVASSGGSGVQMIRRTRRGNDDGAAAQSLNAADVVGFAGVSSEGGVLVANRSGNGGIRPTGFLVSGGIAGAPSLGYRDFATGLQQTVAAMGDSDLGLVAMKVGSTVSIGMMGADGGLLGLAEPQTLSNVGRMAAAAQADGSFLLFWIDPVARKLMAADYGADGKIIGDPFEIQDVDEVVDPDVLAVTPFGGEVLVIYATTGRGGAFRSVFVNLRD